MAAITVRRLDPDTKAKLRVRAARHGRSMEQEAREILKLALSSGSARRGNLAESIRARFIKLGGVELPDLPRDPLRPPPELSR